MANATIISSSPSSGGAQRRVPEGKCARDALLATYNHTPKEENALYTTTNNEIGIKRPTGATFTFERRARQQGFRRVPAPPAARYPPRCDFERENKKSVQLI